jgi:hypothetical protein
VRLGRPRPSGQPVAVQAEPDEEEDDETVALDARVEQATQQSDTDGRPVRPREPEY